MLAAATGEVDVPEIANWLTAHLGTVSWVPHS